MKIYLAVGFMSCMYSSMLLASSSVTAMAVDFPDVPAAQLQLILSVNSLSATIMCVVTGFLVGRFRLKTLSLISMLLMCFGGTAPIFLNSFDAILAFRLVYGIGMGLNHALMPTVISSYLPESKRAIATSVRQSVGNVALVLFGLLSGALSIANWRYPFYIYSFSMIVAVVVQICLPKKEDDLIPSPGMSRRNFALPIYAWGWILLILITQIGVFAYNTNLSQLVIIVMNRTHVQTGIGNSMSGIGGIVGGALLYRTSKTLGRWTIPLTLFLYAGATIIGFFYDGNTPLWLFYAASVFRGFVYFIYNGLIVLNLGNAVKPELRGFAVSCCMAAMQLGNFLSPYVWNPVAVALFSRDMPQDRFLLSGSLMSVSAVIFALIAAKKAWISYTYHEDSA